jgi:hypothetical protein
MKYLTLLIFTLLLLNSISADILSVNSGTDSLIISPTESIEGVYSTIPSSETGTPGGSGSGSGGFLVNQTAPNKTVNQTITDKINDILNLPTEKDVYWFWWLILATVLGFILYYYFKRRKNRQPKDLYSP